MKKNIFVVLVIFSLSFVCSARVFAERGDSITSISLTIPLAWHFSENSFVAGAGASVHRLLLPADDSLLAVDYGATLSLPLSLMENYTFPVNLQGMFGILFVPFNLEKWYLCVGAALGVSVSYALPKGAEFLDSEFSFDFGAGLEIRGGYMIREKIAISFGCTVLYDFSKLDFTHRRYIQEHSLVVLPSIGIGFRKE